jgi:hypothetical protein
MTALSEHLPYWEFEDSDFPHMILWDGSLSGGLELLPLDIECFDEDRVNNLTEHLRAFVNSLHQGLTAQFMVKVETDFKGLIEKHEKLISTSNPFLKNLDIERCEKL